MECRPSGLKVIAGNQKDRNRDAASSLASAHRGLLRPVFAAKRVRQGAPFSTATRPVLVDCSSATVRRSGRQGVFASGANRLHVEFDDVLVLQHVIAFDDRGVVDGRAPDAGEFEPFDVVLVDLAGHV